MKSLTKKELSEELQHVYKQLADIKEDYRKSIETNSMIMKVLKEREDIIDRINKEIERLNKFLRAFSDFIDNEEYWKSLGVNGEDIECKVSHKWNELLYKIVHKGSDKE